MDEVSIVRLQAFVRRRIVRKRVQWLRLRLAKQEQATTSGNWWIRVFDSREQRIAYIFAATLEYHYFDPAPFPQIKVRWTNTNTTEYFSHEELFLLYRRDPGRFVDCVWAPLTEPLPHESQERMPIRRLIEAVQKQALEHPGVLLPRRLRVAPPPRAIHDRVLNDRHDIRVPIAGVSAPWTIQHAWRRRSCADRVRTIRGRKQIEKARANWSDKLVCKWIEIYDPRTKRVYLYNQFTGWWRWATDKRVENAAECGVVRMQPYPKQTLGEELEAAKFFAKPTVDEYAFKKRHLVPKIDVIQKQQTGEGSAKEEEGESNHVLCNIKSPMNRRSLKSRNQEVDLVHNDIFLRNRDKDVSQIRQSSYVDLENSTMFTFKQDLHNSNNFSQNDFSEWRSTNSQHKALGLENETEKINSTNSANKTQVIKHKIDFSIETGCTVLFLVSVESPSKPTLQHWVYDANVHILSKDTQMAISHYEIKHAVEISILESSVTDLALSKQQTILDSHTEIKHKLNNSRISPGTAMRGSPHARYKQAILQIMDHRIVYSQGLGCTIKYLLQLHEWTNKAQNWYLREDILMMSDEDVQALKIYDKEHERALCELGVNLGSTLTTPRVQDICDHRLEYVHGIGLTIVYEIHLAKWIGDGTRWMPRDDLLAMEPHVIKVLQVYEKTHREELEELGLVHEASINNFRFKALAKSAIHYFRMKRNIRQRSMGSDREGEGPNDNHVHFMYMTSRWVAEPRAALAIQMCVRRMIAKKEVKAAREKQQGWVFDGYMWINQVMGTKSSIVPHIFRVQHAKKSVAVLRVVLWIHNAVRVRLLRFRTQEYFQSACVVCIQRFYKRRFALRKARREHVTKVLNDALSLSQYVLKSTASELKRSRAIAFDLCILTGSQLVHRWAHDHRAGISGARTIDREEGAFNVAIDASKMSRSRVMFNNKDIARFRLMCNALAVTSDDSQHVCCFDLLCVIDPQPQHARTNITAFNAKAIENTRKIFEESVVLSKVLRSQYVSSLWQWRVMGLDINHNESEIATNEQQQNMGPLPCLTWTETARAGEVKKLVHVGDTGKGEEEIEGRDIFSTQEEQSKEVSAGELPEWVELYDPRSESKYYFNNHTGESSWDMPVGFIRPSASTPLTSLMSPELLGALKLQNVFRARQARKAVRAQRGAKMVADACVNNKDGLDDDNADYCEGASGAVQVGDWVAVLDPSSGVEYYYNVLTGESVWDMPGVMMNDDNQHQEEEHLEFSVEGKQGETIENEQDVDDVDGELVVQKVDDVSIVRAELDGERQLSEESQGTEDSIAVLAEDENDYALGVKHEVNESSLAAAAVGTVESTEEMESAAVDGGEDIQFAQPLSGEEAALQSRVNLGVLELASDAEINSSEHSLLLTQNTESHEVIGSQAYPEMSLQQAEEEEILGTHIATDESLDRTNTTTFSLQTADQGDADDNISTKPETASPDLRNELEQADPPLDENEGNTLSEENYAREDSSGSVAPESPRNNAKDQHTEAELEVMLFDAVKRIQQFWRGVIGRIQAFHVRAEDTLNHKITNDDASSNEEPATLFSSRWVAVYDPVSRKPFYVDHRTKQLSWQRPFEYRFISVDDLIRFWWYVMQNQGITGIALKRFAFTQWARDHIKEVGRLAYLCKQVRRRTLDVLSNDSMDKKQQLQGESQDAHVIEQMAMATEEIRTRQVRAMWLQTNAKRACIRVDAERLSLSVDLVCNIEQTETFKVAQEACADGGGGASRTHAEEGSNTDPTVRGVLIGWDIKKTQLAFLLESIRDAKINLETAQTICRKLDNSVVDTDTFRALQADMFDLWDKYYCCSAQQETSDVVNGDYGQEATEANAKKRKTKNQGQSDLSEWRCTAVELALDFAAQSIAAYDECTNALRSAASQEREKQNEFENLVQMRIEDHMSLHARLWALRRSRMLKALDLILVVKERACWERWMDVQHHFHFLDTCRQNWMEGKHTAKEEEDDKVREVKKGNEEKLKFENELQIEAENEISAAKAAAYTLAARSGLANARLAAATATAEGEELGDLNDEYLESLDVLNQAWDTDNIHSVSPSDSLGWTNKNEQNGENVVGEGSSLCSGETPVVGATKKQKKRKRKKRKRRGSVGGVEEIANKSAHGRHSSRRTSRYSVGNEKVGDDCPTATAILRAKNLL